MNFLYDDTQSIADEFSKLTYLKGLMPKSVIMDIISLGVVDVNLIENICNRVLNGAINSSLEIGSGEFINGIITEPTEMGGIRKVSFPLFHHTDTQASFLLSQLHPIYIKQFNSHIKYQWLPSIHGIRMGTVSGLNVDESIALEKTLSEIMDESSRTKYYGLCRAFSKAFPTDYQTYGFAAATLAMEDDDDDEDL